MQEISGHGSLGLKGARQEIGPKRRALDWIPWHFHLAFILSGRHAIVYWNQCKPFS
jgi:hypothetical protein